MSARAIGLVDRKKDRPRWAERGIRYRALMIPKDAPLASRERVLDQYQRPASRSTIFSISKRAGTFSIISPEATSHGDTGTGASIRRLMGAEGVRVEAPFYGSFLATGF